MREKKQQVKKSRGMEIEISDFGRDTHAVAVAEALKELSKKMKRAGIFQELKQREHFIPASVKRRVEKNESIIRTRMEQRENIF